MTKWHNRACLDPDCDGMVLKMQWLKLPGFIYLVCDVCASIQLVDLRTNERRWLTAIERQRMQARIDTINADLRRKRLKVVKSVSGSERRLEK